MFEPEPNWGRPWRVDACPLAVIQMTVAELADRLAIAFREFDEDGGLGPARAIRGRLTPDRPIEIVEHETVMRHGPLAGPAVYVDAADLALEGVDNMVNDLLRSLGLDAGDLLWVAEKSSRERAAEKARLVATTPRPPGWPMVNRGPHPL